jgi:serine/threonine protein kinase
LLSGHQFRRLLHRRAERGTIQICDADNIAVDGEPGGVYGTRKFMAPDVVRREALPSTKTDLYSMAVLFFYMIFNWHPLDGRREAQAGIMDQALEMKFYGQEPCFLFEARISARLPRTRTPRLA